MLGVTVFQSLLSKYKSESQYIISHCIDNGNSYHVCRRLQAYHVRTPAISPIRIVGPRSQGTTSPIRPISQDGKFNGLQLGERNGESISNRLCDVHRRVVHCCIFLLFHLKIGNFFFGKSPSRSQILDVQITKAHNAGQTEKKYSQRASIELSFQERKDSVRSSNFMVCFASYRTATLTVD